MLTYIVMGISFIILLLYCFYIKKILKTREKDILDSLDERRLARKYINLLQKNINLPLYFAKRNIKRIVLIGHNRVMDLILIDLLNESVKLKGIIDNDLQHYKEYQCFPTIYRFDDVDAVMLLYKNQEIPFDLDGESKNKLIVLELIIDELVNGLNER